MKQQVWSEDYRVTSYLVNLRGKAGLYAILNFIQDVGWQHAHHLQVRLGKNRGWVFTRQKLIMSDWPVWNEILTVQTWLRPPADNFLLRAYVVYIGDRQIGSCTSTFTVMDMETRKISVQDWSAFPQMWRMEGHLIHQPQKILFQSDVENLARFEVRNSDIDLNQHVNNTKYAQWILDAIPIDILKAGTDLIEYEVNFLSETKLGDEVIIQKVREDQPDDIYTNIQFQGLRSRDQAPVFTARMKVKPSL